MPQRFEMLHWIESGSAVIYPFEGPITSPTSSVGCSAILAWEMGDDLADASLYWRSVETGTTEIMTTDITGFTRYRLPGRKRLSLL
jgi:hypothetical protein